jgi:hypothetical protein
VPLNHCLTGLHLVGSFTLFLHNVSMESGRPQRRIQLE